MVAIFIFIRKLLRKVEYYQLIISLQASALGKASLAYTLEINVLFDVNDFFISSVYFLLRPFSIQLPPPKAELHHLQKY